MPLRKLLHVVIQNIARSKKNFIFSSIGIIVGITTFTFFIALSQGIQDRVLNKIFPIDQLEIEPIGGVAAAATSDEEEGGLGSMLTSGPRMLDGGAVAQLETIRGVAKAYPKMRARFPAKIETGILERRMAGEGFLEGLKISAQVIEEMRGFEEQCSQTEVDVCRRREVSCVRNSDCPHEGMECLDGMCQQRRYWRSFHEKHAHPECTSSADCNSEQVCAVDRWIILRVGKKEMVKPLKEAVKTLSHPKLDLDYYIAIAEVGSVSVDNVVDAERTGAEIWTVGAQVSDKAREALRQQQHKATVRELATVDEALAYIQGIPRQLEGGRCAGLPCKLVQTEYDISSWRYFRVYENHRADCPAALYCAARNVLSEEGRCEPYMPLALNPMMITFYNSTVVSQLGTPPLPNACMVLGLKGYFRLGFSFLRESRAAVWQRLRWGEIVGFTDKAMHLGGTVPIEYVERYNQWFLGPEAVAFYDSVLLQIPRNEDVAEVIEQVQKQSFDLSNNSKFARKAGEMLMIVTLTFLLISLIIIVISAMNISHTFLMVIFERQREFGIMRAIGASRWDIRMIVLTESVFIGLIAGVAGNALSFGVSRLVNLLAGGLRERFPLIPDDFFVYSWELVLGSIVFALIFCLAGAWVPADRAAKMDPAAVLSQA